jgi:plastocyanin
LRFCLPYAAPGAAGSLLAGSVIQTGRGGVSVGMSLSPPPRVIGPAAALIAVVATVGLAGCGGGGSSGTTAGTTAAQSSAEGGAQSSGAQTVEIKGFAFHPADLTVARGTAVEFPNEDSSPHTVTAKSSEAFDSGTIQPGKSAELTFAQPGTFAYYCQFHPFMKGTITVE